MVPDLDSTALNYAAMWFEVLNVVPDLDFNSALINAEVQFGIIMDVVPDFILHQYQIMRKCDLKSCVWFQIWILPRTPCACFSHGAWRAIIPVPHHTNKSAS